MKVVPGFLRLRAQTRKNNFLTENSFTLPVQMDVLDTFPKHTQSPSKLGLWTFSFYDWPEHNYNQSLI